MLPLLEEFGVGDDVPNVVKRLKSNVKKAARRVQLGTFSHDTYWRMCSACLCDKTTPKISRDGNPSHTIVCDGELK